MYCLQCQKINFLKQTPGLKAPVIKVYRKYKEMLSYCVKFRKTTENLDSKILKTKNNRIIMQSKCLVCGNKKSRFVTKKEAKGLLSKFGV